ncbi:hypothetical protein [Streptomyces sp. NRRL F-5123]|uniref:hypothetical protein n=1 Tax=Streptomyces sp. NRRL F-5123 TaxID=1463856 RepID=UPI0004E268EA|nr:hypothetical protein [Streptomyces sp. NRRL F-5123]
MTQEFQSLDPITPEDILIVYGFHQARRYPEFNRENVYTLHGVAAFGRLRGRRPKRIFHTGLGLSREADRLRVEFNLLEAKYGTAVYHVNELDRARIEAEFMKNGPCFICGDPVDHYGQPHRRATSNNGWVAP